MQCNTFLCMRSVYELKFLFQRICTVQIELYILNALNIFVILWFISVIRMATRCRMHWSRKLSIRRTIRSDPAFNGIFRLSLLWFFSLFLMECQCHYWHTIYSQSIQSSRLHSDFQSRFLFSKSLADPHGLGDSINNKFIRSHSFVVQICIYEYLDLLENPCLLWRVSTTTLKNIHNMWN